MLCLTLSAGVLSAAAAGPDGCAVDSYVALSPVEFNQYMVSPFKLDSAEASSISVAVMALWALGWGFRMAVRVLRDSGSPESVDD